MAADAATAAPARQVFGHASNGAVSETRAAEPLDVPAAYGNHRREEIPEEIPDTGYAVGRWNVGQHPHRGLEEGDSTRLALPELP